MWSQAGYGIVMLAGIGSPVMRCGEGPERSDISLLASKGLNTLEGLRVGTIPE